MASKFVLPCLLGMMSLFCVPTLRTATQKVAHDPTPSQQSLIEVKKEAARDYAGEELISDGKLVVTATSSTYTSLGQSFSLTFSLSNLIYMDHLLFHLHLLLSHYLLSKILVLLNSYFVINLFQY